MRDAAYARHAFLFFLAEKISHSSHAVNCGDFWLSEIKKLKEQIKVANLDFFDNFDTDVRNAFFHISYEFRGKNIVIHKIDNTEKEISLKDLLILNMHADRSAYVVMHNNFWWLNDLIGRHF